MEPFLIKIHLTFERQKSTKVKRREFLNKKEVLEVWIDKYAQRLVRIAYTYVKDWLKAEDQVQEAFIKAFHSMDQLKI